MVWIIIVLAVVVLLGFRQVGEKERAAVTLFGKLFRILRPGLNWIFPGIMRIKERVPTCELSLPLFESSSESPVQIDFSDGWAIPKGANVWVVMKSPDDAYSVDEDKKKSGAYRAIFEIADWRKSIQLQIENAVRTYLNRFTVDEAVTMGKAGFNLANHDPDSGLPNRELEEIEKTLEGWGWELKKVTVGDFALDPKLTEARSKVHLAKKASEAADYTVKKQAKEWVGMVIESLAEIRGKPKEAIQEEIDLSEDLQREFLDYAKTVNLRLEEADRDALAHVVVDGGNEKEKEGSGGNFLEQVEKMMIRILAAREMMSKTKKETSPVPLSPTETGKAAGKPGERRPAKSILPTLASSLPRKLNEEESAKLEQELANLPKEERDEWAAWLAWATGSGNLKTE